MDQARGGRLRGLAELVAAASIAVVFACFVFGVGMRYLADRPVPWVDEVVTILSVWSTFWTAAFVLQWREFIAFDVVYSLLAPRWRRVAVASAILAFSSIMLAAMPGMVDYTLFLWRETTDTLRWRLDIVYAVFPAFFVVILVRVLLALRRLATARWADELASWDTGEESP